MGICEKCGNHVKYQSVGKIFKCENANLCNNYIKIQNFLKNCENIKNYYNVKLKQIVNSKLIYLDKNNVIYKSSLHTKLPYELWLIINEYIQKYKIYNYNKKNLFIINKHFINNFKDDSKYDRKYNSFLFISNICRITSTIDYFTDNLHKLNIMFLEHVKQQTTLSQFIYPKKYYINLEKNFYNYKDEDEYMMTYYTSTFTMN
jgi:hypothetical protein